MTEQEAVARAWEVIRAKDKVVMGLESIRKVSGEQLPPSLSALGDIWAIHFAVPKVSGERAVGGETVFVQVLDRTGEATIPLTK